MKDSKVYLGFRLVSRSGMTVSLRFSCWSSKTSVSNSFFLDNFFSRSCVLGLIVNFISLISPARPRRVFKMSRLYFPSSHSLLKALGTDKTTTPSFLDKIKVFLNQVTKLALDRASSISAKAVCHNSSLSIFLWFLRTGNFILLDITCGRNKSSVKGLEKNL